MEAAAAMYPDYMPVVAAAPGIDLSYYGYYLTPGIPLVSGDTFELMHHAEVALVTSGTATLECAPDRHPTGSMLQSQRNKALLQNNGETAENILRIAPQPDFREKIIPEMLVHMCTPKLVGRELGNILPGRPGHDNQLEGYREMRAILGTNDAPATASGIIHQLANRKQQ